jgi:hypothetical protein
VFFVDVSAGLLNMSGGAELRKGTEVLFAEELQSRGLAFSAGAGLGWGLGPGRLTAQLQWG